AHAPQRTGDVALAEVDAARKVDHHRALTAVQQRHQAGNVDPVYPGGELEHRHALATGGADRLQPALYDEHVTVPHLAPPATSQAGAHASRVHQHDARVADAHPLVGRLHQLAARRADTAWPVTGAVLGRVANVEHIQRAIGILFEACQVDRTDHADSGLLG